MIELKRLKLINWHNFENVTFDCARLTYMIGVNAVGKTTILDAIRYCLTTNRNFNALGNKKSGRTLQGSVHAKQRGENAYRRPGRTVAYIGAEFWDSVKRTHFVIAVRVESEGPMQELHPGDQTWYISEDGCTLEQLSFIDPRTGAPSSKENFKPAVGRLSYTRSPGEARDRICRALGIGRAASPLGKKFNEVFQMGTSMDEIPNFREFLYQYILPQPELDLEALQGDRVELENLHAVLAEAQTRAAALEQIVDYGREAAQKETEALVNRGTALLARAEEAAAGTNTWQEHLAAGKRQHEELTARYAAAKDAEAEARRAYLSAHSAAASGEGRALDALSEELARKKTALDKAGRDASRSEAAAGKVQSLLQSLQRSGFAVEKSLWPASLTAETLPQLQSALAGLEKPLEEQYFAARQSADALTAEVQEKQAELASVSGGRWVYPHGDAATRVRDAVNAELKSRGMTPDAKIFCELLSVEDESWQDCVEACLGDRRFDILVPPAHYAAAKSAFVALRDKVGPISLLDTPSIRTANRKADAAPADSLAAQVRSENPLAAQYADTILRRIVCCDTPDTLENYPDSATRDLLRHHPFRLERLRTPQRYIGLDARRARAEALTKALDELTARSREAAQSAVALKAARDSYQDVLHSSVMDELAALWDARAALEAARADCTAQEQKLAECRENPMLQQLYKEDEAREAAWDAARAAVETAGGDIRVCEKQLASCEAEQTKAEETARQARDAADRFFAQYPLLEPLARERFAALSKDKGPRYAAQSAEKAQARLDDALAVYLTGTLEPAQKEYNTRYVCDHPLGLFKLGVWHGHGAIRHQPHADNLRLLQGSGCRRGVGPHQPAGTQQNSAKVPRNHHDHIRKPRMADGFQHGGTGGFGGFAVITVAGAAALAQNIGIHMMPRGAGGRFDAVQVGKGSFLGIGKRSGSNKAGTLFFIFKGGNTADRLIVRHRGSPLRCKMMYLKKIPQMLPSAVYKTLMQLLASLVGVAALKALNTSAGVNQLLLAGVEGMALAANFNADLRLGIAGMDHVAACAGNGAIHIVGMNTLLHFHFTSFSIMTKGSHT